MAVTGPDQVLANRYALLEPLGRGGMGVIWRARDQLLERQVAVKEIRFPPELASVDQEKLCRRVLREAQAAARLSHPGAVTVFDVIETEDLPFIVMELVDAPTLADVVHTDGPMDPTRAAEIGLQVLETLDAAHAQGIVHRDVKPANVMVPARGPVKLTDFGIASIKDDPSVTTTGLVAGSPSYMAPEQAEQAAAGPFTDLWALGATLYFAVEGQPPFDRGEPIPTLVSITRDPARPPQRAGPLAPVLDALLQKRPATRPDASALRPMLERVASRRGRAAPAPTPVPTEVTAALPTATAHEHPASQADEPPATHAAPSAPPSRPQPRPSRPPPARRDGRDRRWRTPLLVALALVVLAVAGLAVLVAGDRDGSSDGGQAAPTTASAEPTGQGESDGAAPSSSSAQGGQTSATVAFTDPTTGFKVSYPRGWQVSRNGAATDFRDSRSGTYLRVEHVQPPGPSPVDAWFRQETSFAPQHPGYRRIDISSTEFKGRPAAVWEFTYLEGGAELHALDLGFTTPTRGFAMYFQTRAADWERMKPTFEALKQSFVVP